MNYNRNLKKKNINENYLDSIEIKGQNYLKQLIDLLILMKKNILLKFLALIDQ